MKYNLRRSKERLKEALGMIDTLKEKMPSMQAKDLHFLSKCHFDLTPRRLASLWKIPDFERGFPIIDQSIW